MIDPSLQHHKTHRTERIRLRTVIEKFCTIACKVVKQGMSSQQSSTAKKASKSLAVHLRAGCRQCLLNDRPSGFRRPDVSNAASIRSDTSPSILFTSDTCPLIKRSCSIPVILQRVRLSGKKPCHLPLRVSRLLRLSLSCLSQNLFRTA